MVRETELKRISSDSTLWFLHELNDQPITLDSDGKDVYHNDEYVDDHKGRLGVTIKGGDKYERGMS